MRIGSLFSGIGGLELGLERAIPGAHVVWQVEIDPFCRRVLAKHWPEAKRYDDVAAVDRSVLAPVDLICGGFPCQDVSSAGKRAGLTGAKSGLWREYRRIVAETRPRFVVVENVASGKKLWLPTVRADLEALGYRARAFALSAADVGAPHLRRRVFVFADAHSEGEPTCAVHAEVGSASKAVADANLLLLRDESGRRSRKVGGDPSVAGHDCTATPTDAPRVARRATHEDWRTSDGFAQPDMVRVVHGVSRGLDGPRRRALGNSVVPQCAEVIGRMIAEHLA